LEGPAGTFELATDAQGRFDRPLPLGRYAATFVGPDGGALFLPALVLDASTSAAGDLSLALLPTVSVEVLVLRPQEREAGSKEKSTWIPAVGAAVGLVHRQASRLGQNATTGGEGLALFEGLLAQPHELVVSLSEDDATRYVAEVTLGERPRLVVQMAERAVLKGKVTDGVEGPGVSEAVITLRHGAEEADGVFETTLETVPGGSFEVPVPRSKARAVHVSAAGFMPWPSTPTARFSALSTLNRVGRPRTKPLHIVLEQGILVRGMFVPAEDVVLPPEGLAFSFWSRGGVTIAGRSDPDGSFEIAGLGTGRWGIKFRTPGWAAPTFRLTLRAAMGPVFDLPDIRLLRASGLRGRVLDVAGRPVAGAYVARLPPPAGQPAGTFTDPLGQWALPDAFASRSGYLRATLGELVTRIVPIPKGAEQTVDLHLLPTGRVTGRVQDKDSGAGVPGVTVTLSPADRYADPDVPEKRTERTDATGVFTVSGLLPGGWHVVLEGIGFRPHAGVTVEVRVEKPVELALQLDPGVVFAGQCVDEQGTPLPGTKIHVSGTDTSGWISRRTLNTDAAGRFRVGGLPEGTYVLRALQDGYQPFVKQHLSRSDDGMKVVLHKKSTTGR